MTRINSAIPVKYLIDEMLLAEHREIKRLPSVLSKAIHCNSINKIPNKFCLGTGNLLAAAIKAGADPNKVYGIEIDPDIVKIAKERLLKLGVPSNNIRLGNALDPASYNFN